MVEGRDISVGIATRYGVDGPGIASPFCPPPPAAGGHPVDTRTYGISSHTSPKPTVSHRLCGLYEARSLEGIPHSTPTKKKRRELSGHIIIATPHPSTLQQYWTTTKQRYHKERPNHRSTYVWNCNTGHTDIHNTTCWEVGKKHADIIKKYWHHQTIMTSSNIL